MEWVVLGLIAFGIARGLVVKLRENHYNAELTSRLETQRTYLEARDNSFREGFCRGRKWLALLIAEVEEANDSRDTDLLYKSHPARKAAEVVKEIKEEKKELTQRVKFLEYQLKSYEEYFPQLEEYRDLILDERVPLASGADNLGELEATDPTEKFLSREEWAELSVSDRNQLALDRYLGKQKSDWEIGRFYERYLGYLREIDGWVVTYHGALHGFEDLGRDLVCAKGREVEIVQAKCWSRSKLIHEKHLFQLFGSTIHYKLANPGVHVTAVLSATTSLSDVATEVANVLGIRVEGTTLPSVYPLVKCNINQSSKERIYHLPFDQQYDRTQICYEGECYVTTVREAEALGFRRAWRHRVAEPTR